MADILSSSEVIRRLRDLRRAKGMSAQDVANVTGISRSTIANMEIGRKVSLDVDEAAAICSALGVDLRVVLSDEPMPVARQVWVV